MRCRAVDRRGIAFQVLQVPVLVIVDVLQLVLRLLRKAMAPQRVAYRWCRLLKIWARSASRAFATRFFCRGRGPAKKSSDNGSIPRAGLSFILSYFHQTKNGSNCHRL